jgi:hypothetical protein
MNKLPAIGFNSPPELPGGGVIWRNRLGVRALKPATKSVYRIQPSQNKPKAMASVDTKRLKRLTINRLVYRFIGVRRFLAGQVL